MPQNLVEVICAGQFGAAIAADLALLRPEYGVRMWDEHSDSLPDAHIYVAALWRATPALCDALDRLCHKMSRAFVTITAEATTLRIGPVVLPGRGACWRCWTKRQRQHDPWADRREALLQYYHQHPGEGPKGYIGPFSMLGAAKLAAVLDRILSGSALGGYIWEIDMITRDMFDWTVIGVHGCHQCGLQRPAETRSVTEMRESLKHLWSERNIDAP